MENMLIRGKVIGGVVVLEPGPKLPEGAAVTVSYEEQPDVERQNSRKRTEVPLVRSNRLGSVRLNGKRIAEILDEEDAAGRR